MRVNESIILWYHYNDELDKKYVFVNLRRHFLLQPQKQKSKSVTESVLEFYCWQSYDYNSKIIIEAFVVKTYEGFSYV